MRHCNFEAELLDIWYLKDIKGFKQRRLELYKCPICKIKIACLIETRMSDGQEFINKIVGPKVEKFARIEKSRILYTYLQSQSPTFFKDWIVGYNSGIMTRSGKKRITQIRQYAGGYKNGKKLLIKKIKV